MPNSRPTILLVHGAFAESSSWNQVIERLQTNDHSTAPQVDGPDVIAVANPLRSLSGDAAYVRDVVGSIDGQVILVGHSYGGMVITEAAAGLDSVVALVYVAAFAPDTGESALQLSGMFPGSTLGEAITAYPITSGGNELAIERERFHQQFAADLPPQDAALMAATQRPVTEAALAAGLATDSPAWKYIPSWFVFGDQDLNIPAELHRFVAERACAVRSHEIAGGSHALSVSHPEEVAQVILEATAGITMDADA